MEETVAVMCVSKREGGRQREQEPITHGVSSPIWSDRQSAEGKKQILVRREVLLKQFPRTNSSGKSSPFVSWTDRHSFQKDNLDLPHRRVRNSPTEEKTVLIQLSAPLGLKCSL